MALAIGGSLALCSTSSLAECKLCRGLNYLLLPSGEPASNLPHDASTRILNGVAFPSALAVGDEELWFSGGGDRYEYGLVKVYTAASYLSRDYFHECDPAEASSSPSHLLPIAIPPPPHRHPTSSPSPSHLLTITIPPPHHHQAPFSEIVASGDAKMMVLHMHYPASIDEVAESINKHLAPRLPQATAATTLRHLSGALTSNKIAQGGLHPGDEIFLSCEAGTMSVAFGAADDASKKALSEPGLCEAFWGIYLSKSPVFDAVKEGMARGFPERAAALCGVEAEALSGGWAQDLAASAAALPQSAAWSAAALEHEAEVLEHTVEEDLSSLAAKLRGGGPGGEA